MPAVFGGINTPYINETTLKRVMSNRQKDNIFQGIIARPNEACTEKYSTDTDAAEIQIVRLKPDNAQARDIGSDTNGGFFNSASAVINTTEAYGIKVLTTIDHNIDIPTNQDDMINIDVAEAATKNLFGKVDTNVNALTIAAQLAKILTCLAKTSPTGNKVVLDETDPDYLSAILDANAFLDDGNEAQGIQSYPRDERAIIMRPTFRANLLKKGHLVLNSDMGQTIVKKGGLDSETTLERIIGYVGEVDGTPCYVASKSIWNLVEKYLLVNKVAMSTGALNKIDAMVVSAIGTGRALAFADSIKTIPAPSGQGIRIQPKYRMGAECWDEYSVVPIVEHDFANPATTDQAVTVVAPASHA